LKIVTFTSNRNLNLQKMRKNSHQFSCSVSNYLSLGSIHGILTIIPSMDNLIIIKRYKVKWWDSFASESKSSKLVVMEWLQHHQKA
jgi:hypothetical protein